MASATLGDLPVAGNADIPGSGGIPRNGVSASVTARSEWLDQGRARPIP